LVINIVIFRKDEHVYPTDESNRLLWKVGRFISHLIAEDSIF